MKKWRVILITGIMILACAGCGTQEVQEAAEAEVREEATVEETDANAEDGQAEEEQAVSEIAESKVTEKNDSNSDLETKSDNGEITAFAEKIQAAVANKDLETLADMCTYPVAVNGEVVEERDAFMELGEDVIFTEERCAAIAAVDIATLEETMAGVVMGDATPNIIFKSVDGQLGIAGIN